MRMQQLEQLQKTYYSLLPLKKEYQEKLEKKFRLEFNYNSNHLEGNTLSYNETELLLIFDETQGNHKKREYDEMHAHDVAYQLVKEWASENRRELTEIDIKNLNEIILVRPYWKEAITNDGQNTRRLIKIGNYKEHPNSVRLENGEIFEYASPAEAPILMAELIKWFREESEKKELHPAELAALLHYKFVRIHPFDDGNGRISRLLMNYVLLKNNLPPVIIKSEDKKNYLRALNRADSGDLESFVDYVSQQLRWSLEVSIKAAKGENIDELGDLDKKIKLLKQKLNSSEEVVKIEKNKDSILQALENGIFPLLTELSEKFRQLDSLFKSKFECIKRGDNYYGPNLLTSMEHIKNALLKNTMFNFFTYLYQLKEFRKGTKSFNVDFTLSIEFHQIVYELKSIETNFSITKLYHEDFSIEERNQIVEKLGTSLFEKIEKSV